MATLKATTVVEQNANTMAGAQVTSATYVGTNITADLTIRVGRTAPLVQIVGTQTASTVYVALDTNNAYHGAQVCLKRLMGTPGTSVISVFSGLVGTGYAVSTAIYTGTGGALNLTFGFDGVAQEWR